MALLFAGESPHGLMISRISSIPNLIISNGLFACLNRCGVIVFTRASVHCAESRTAISKVNASVWSSGIGVSGYSFSNSILTYSAASFFFITE